MNNWTLKNLGDAMWAEEALGKIKQSFQEAYQSAGEPDEMALFSRYESDGRLHCEVVLYFSPAASKFAQQLGAFSCHRPTLYDLSLLIGSTSNWSNLFNDEAI